MSSNYRAGQNVASCHRPHDRRSGGFELAGVNTEQARDFYRAAAGFYRQSPWLSVGGDEPIKVKCEPLDGGPRFAIVLGKKGKVKGLWLCDDWKTCLLVERGRYETIAEHIRYTALHFGGRTEVSPNDLEKIRRHGFEVAGPRAYPAVLRKEPGEDFRSPDAGELELLESCLFVTPDFLKRAGDRKPDVYEYAFKGMAGKMSLDLSWVPKERLQTELPERPS
jgi:hypothetical protein